MKNKILVDVFVPYVNQVYNVFIPVNKTVGEVITLLNKTINELTEERFPISNHLSLMNMVTSEIYSFEYTVKDNKIPNGSKLVLI